MQNIRTIYDHTQAFYGLLNPHGVLLEANQSFLTLVNAGAVPFSGKPFWESQWWTSKPDSAIKLKNAVRQGVTGEFSRFETEHSAADENRHCIDFSITPVYSEKKEVTSLVIEGRDITDLKDSQQALIESEARFRSLVELSSDWYWELDREYRFVEISWSDGRPAEASDNSPVGKPRWELSSAESSDNNLMDWSDHQALLARHEPFRDFEYEHVSKSGDVTWICANGIPVFDSTNRFQGYRGTSRDITEQKHARLRDKENEFRLRLAVDISEIGIWEWNIFRDEIFWDTKTLQLFGLEEREGPIPRSTYYNAVHPDDRVRVQNLTQSALQDDKPVFFEYRIVRPDGSIRWLLGHHSGIVHTTNARSSSLLIGVNLDITKSKHIEMALRESQRQLQAINQTLEKRIAERTAQLETEAEQHRKTQSELAITRRLDSIGQLAGGVAHDFNNLLAVIGGNLELAAKHVTHGDACDLIAAARMAVETGTSLNQRLLTFARKQKLSPVVLSPNDRVSETVRLLERTLGENYPVAMVLDSSLWNTFVDASEIDSALVNLALNARDAMPGGGQITIETRNIVFGPDDAQLSAENQPGEYIGIFVADTGSGMTPDVMDKALDPFFTTKELGQGTGLGLSSVYGFVKESGGFLVLESHPNEGTTVRIHLPRATEAIAPQPSIVVDKQISHPNNAVILVVEDDPMVRKITVKRLDHLGYGVIETSNAREAMDELEKGAPVDLVFTDVVLPGGVTGYELAEWLSSHRKDVEVLFTSGYIDPATHANSESTTPNIEVLNKPYSMDLLAQKIREVLEPA